MTPEDDVNKDTDQDSTEKSEVEQATDAPENAPETSPKSPDTKTTESEMSPADVADKAADALRDISADKDDIDVAATAQAESEKDGSTAAEAIEDDPLGFLDKNENGSVANPDADDVESLQKQLSDAQAKVSAQQEQLLRVQAEMENQRKRAQNDVTKAHKFALEKIALDLLPVKDSLEMGLQAATVEDAELTKIIEGSELTLKMLTQALEKYNIVEVNPVDEKFDPEFHQAMSMQPVEGKEPNTVASVMQKGYTLNERLIRPALVMVAK